MIHRGSWIECVMPAYSAVKRRWPALPRCPGIYAIYDGASLLYIGSSVDLLKRLRAHGNSGRWPDAARIKFSPMGSRWVERERRLVARLRPSGNKEWNRDHNNEPCRLYPVPGGGVERITRAEFQRRWGR